MEDSKEVTTINVLANIKFKWIVLTFTVFIAFLGTGLYINYQKATVQSKIIDTLKEDRDAFRSNNTKLLSIIKDYDTRFDLIQNNLDGLNISTDRLKTNSYEKDKKLEELLSEKTQLEKNTQSLSNIVVQLTKILTDISNELLKISEESPPVTNIVVESVKVKKPSVHISLHNLNLVPTTERK